MQIYVVMQDCWKRGVYRDWAAAQMEIADENNIQIEPLRYYQSGASELIQKAHKQGLEMPFFTDGEKFSKYILDFVPKTTVKKSGKVEKVAKAVKG